MVTSMTGFGRGKVTEQDFNITVEIKSVNHRYFEYSSRMPRSFQFLDDSLKTLCAQKISRGKVELNVQFEDTSSKSIELAVNTAYADAYISALHKFAKDYKLKDDIKASSIVGNTEIFTVKKRDIDEEQIKQAVTTAAIEAIDNFIADFYCQKAKLIIEIDGKQHQTEEGIKKDEFRTEILEGYDLKIIRFTNRQINRNFQRVCDYIDLVVKENL